VIVGKEPQRHKEHEDGKHEDRLKDLLRVFLGVLGVFVVWGMVYRNEEPGLALLTPVAMDRDPISRALPVSFV